MHHGLLSKTTKIVNQKIACFAGHSKVDPVKISGGDKTAGEI